MENPENQTNQYYAYNKKSFWKWLLIYVVIGLIAYGLMYYFFDFKRHSFQNQKQEDNYQLTESISEQSNSVSVMIVNSKFIPENITIHRGATVIWTNNDDSMHTITADKNNGPMSPQLKKGEKYIDTFISTGAFQYHCSLHSNMKGVINVVD